LHLNLCWQKAQESCQIQTPHPWIWHPSPWMLTNLKMGVPYLPIKSSIYNEFYRWLSDWNLQFYVIFQYLSSMKTTWYHISIWRFAMSDVIRPWAAPVRLEAPGPGV
jgi:hypothetical protein